MVLKKDQEQEQKAQAKASDDKGQELPDGGRVVAEQGAVADNTQADTDFVDRTVRSQKEALKDLKGGDADPREVVDKEHVEVAGGEVVIPDPTVPAPGTLLPKNSSEEAQGNQPGRHVPAAQRLDAEGRPLN
jgi:hypothetical protein